MGRGGLTIRRIGEYRLVDYHRQKMMMFEWHYHSVCVGN